jgi:hypothetical protein
MGMTMEDKLRSLLSDDGSEGFGVDQSFVGRDHPGFGRMVDQHDAKEAPAPCFPQNFRQTPQLQRSEAAGSGKDPGGMRGAKADKGDGTADSQGRKKGFRLGFVRVGSHEIRPEKEALLPGCGDQCIVVAGDYEYLGGRPQGSQLRVRLFEFGRQRQLGQVAGHDQLVERHRTERPNENLENFESMLMLSAKLPAGVTEGAFVEEP